MSFHVYLVHPIRGTQDIKQKKQGLQLQVLCTHSHLFASAKLQQRFDGGIPCPHRARHSLVDELFQNELYIKLAGKAGDR